MKTSNYFCIVLAALMLASCYQPDVVMHTIIHDDFRCCTREVSYSNVMSQEQRDSLWGKGQMEWSRPLPECLNIYAFCKSHTEIGDSDTVTTTFEQTFKSVGEMCEQTPLQLNGTRLRSKATLDKRFRWFYTEYTYTETFYCVSDTFKLPATDYADAEVVNYWFTGRPNLLEGLSGAEASQVLSEMEPKITKWLNDNLFRTCFDFIVSHYDSIAQPPVSRERFVALQDSLAHFLMNGRDDITDVDASKEFRDFFHSDAYAIFFDDSTQCGQGLNAEFTNRLNIFWFNVPYALTMPGTVIDAGDGTLQPDGSIVYHFTGERLIPHDYVVTAKSRQTNLWAYILSLLIILLAVGCFVIKRRKVSV